MSNLWEKQENRVRKSSDLHLISTALGIKTKPRDRVDSIFSAPDFEELFDWLRHQPLLTNSEKILILWDDARGHFSDWDLPTAKSCAKAIEEVLQHGDFHWLIENMYADKPDRWSLAPGGLDRLRYSINVLTRMRFYYSDHRLDFLFAKKLKPASAAELTLWLKLTEPTQNTKYHLRVLGKFSRYTDAESHFALDTGCVWGNRMTAGYVKDQYILRKVR